MRDCQGNLWADLGAFLRDPTTPTMGVPIGNIWLEGYNPWNCYDSRNYGPVPASLIIGRVVLRVWPPSERGGS